MFLKSTSVLPEEVFLVYGSLRTGGIETLIVRIANFFVESEVSVCLCCTAGGELESALNSHVSVVVYRDTSDLVRSMNTRQYQGRTESEVLVMSFDPISAARALKVEAVLISTRKVTHLSGVFHPRAYFMTGERKDRIFLNYLLALAIGRHHLFFMNEECRRTHSTKWHIDLSSSPLLALPINCKDAMWQASDKAAVRVVSVGRLVDFKSYNLGAAGIVRACLDRGVTVTWDIFGDGPLRSSIQAEIEALGVAPYVRLMGVLHYNDFPERVASYDLFVGMGTAALEAAMMGVPTICATVDEASLCYGYLHNLPFGNIGELQLISPNVELVELIENYSAAGQTQRTFLSIQSRSVAAKYGMPQFAEAIMNMVVSAPSSPPKFAKRAVAELYRFATESFVAKAVRRCVSKKVRSA